MTFLGMNKKRPKKNGLEQNSRGMTNPSASGLKKEKAERKDAHV